MDQFKIERDAVIAAARRDRDIERMGSDTVGGLDSADRRCDKRIGNARNTYTFMLRVHGI